MITKIHTTWEVDLIQATKPDGGIGLATFRVLIPRWAWLELGTHGRIVRNAASARAISPIRYLQELGAYLPTQFYGDAPMGDTDGRIPQEQERAIIRRFLSTYTFIENQIIDIWGESQTRPAREAINRLHTTNHMILGIVTATTPAWEAVIALRQKSSGAARDFAEKLTAPISATLESAKFYDFSWHIPDPSENATIDNLQDTFDEVAARIARVSYGNHKGKTPDYELAQRLKESKHASPFEHIAFWMPEERAQSSRLNCVAADRAGGYAWQTYRNMIGL